MKRAIIVDTGPLVAYLNSKEKAHQWVKMQLSSLEPPLYTCEAVISETHYLLKKFTPGEQVWVNLLYMERMIK